MRIAGTAVQVALILFVSGTVIHATAQSAKSKDQAAQESYCHATGGMIEVRHAVFGTNDDRRNWLWLGAQEQFCQYTASDGSRIHLSLETLTQKHPTLATLAYYAQVPWDHKGNGNPASFYCTQLGGSEIGATNFAGGGWVAEGGIDEILEACIFPDNSTIDSWGLLYHSADIIRGVDLATVLTYANPFPKKTN